ncbi:MAG: 1-deoxy-D-xylulose-5-phosphate reductoisomerase [Paenibacillaceae bacterium]
MKRRISILGSTGSIGTQTLEVIAKHPELFQVESLAAGSNIKLLLEQIHQFKPKLVSVFNSELADQVRREAPADVKILHGELGLLEVAVGGDSDFLVSAIMGSLGLKPTLAAIEAGKMIGLANKETLVSAGHIVTKAARRHNATLLPIDSEHSAIFQCLNGESIKEVSKLIITASGGSFRDQTREQLKNVTVEQALKHPNWSMGAKITIDSATMANKGLEVIEAHWLFELDYSQIEVMIHPESIVHSMVEFVDYSVIAQLGTPNMRVPIQYALTYPNRLPTPSAQLKLTEIGSLHFRPMDYERYPCLRMAIESGITGGTASTVYNAANEIAVARFLNKDIDFLSIESIISDVLNQHQVATNPDLESILEADAWARTTASQITI